MSLLNNKKTKKKKEDQYLGKFNVKFIYCNAETYLSYCIVQ